MFSTIMLCIICLEFCFMNFYFNLTNVSCIITENAELFLAFCRIEKIGGKCQLLCLIMIIFPNSPTLQLNFSNDLT